VAIKVLTIAVDEFKDLFNEMLPLMVVEEH
jgi:hypothetical protein